MEILEHNKYNLNFNMDYQRELLQIRHDLFNIAANNRKPGSKKKYYGLSLKEFNPLVFTYPYNVERENIFVMLNPYPTKQNNDKTKFTNEKGRIDAETYRILREIEKYLKERNIQGIYCCVVKPPKPKPIQKTDPFKDVLYSTAPRWLKIIKITDERCRLYITAQVLDEPDIDALYSTAPKWLKVFQVTDTITKLYITDKQYIDQQKSITELQPQPESVEISIINNIKNSLKDSPQCTIRENYFIRNSNEYFELMRKYTALEMQYRKSIDEISRETDSIIMKYPKSAITLSKLKDKIEGSRIDNKGIRIKNPPSGIKKLLPGLVRFRLFHPELKSPINEIGKLYKREVKDGKNINDYQFCNKNTFIKFLNKWIPVWNILHPEDKIMGKVNLKNPETATALFNKLNSSNVNEFLNSIPQHIFYATK